MKFLRALIPILLASVTFSPIDYEKALTLRVEGLIQQHPVVKSYRYTGNGWFEFTNEDGRTWFRNFGDARTKGGLKPKKIISIDLRQIDTTGYSTLFQEVAEIPLGTGSKPPIGSFIANDGACELTAQYYQQGAGFDDIRMFKRVRSTMLFQQIHIYPRVFSPIGVSDMDHNGIPEIVGDSLGSLLTFEASGVRMLDFTLKHFWTGVTGTAQVPRIADLDGDTYPEVLLHQFGNGFLGLRIVKYDSTSRMLKTSFELVYPHHPEFRGYWAVGDFDLDGRTEFATAKSDGEVCFVEHRSGENGYAISFTDTTRYINAFFHTEGDDLDGDGRPECFIGSDDTGGLANIAVYESVGNNRFEVTAWIELYPLSSFIAEWIWTGDVDGDQKGEIVLTSGSTLVVLKALSDDDWRVVWYKRYNASTCHRLFDIDGDGTDEIILSVREYSKNFTRLLARNAISSISEAPRHASSNEVRVFPQPGNTSIWIEFINAPKDNIFHIISSTGKIVRTLSIPVDTQYPYLTAVSTRDLQSGVYFITSSSIRASSTTKFILFH